MTNSRKFDAREYFAIHMALNKLGLPQEFVEILMAKVWLNTQFRAAGRPAKKDQESIDVQRVNAIQAVRDMYPNESEQEIARHLQALSSIAKRLPDIAKRMPDLFAGEFTQAELEKIRADDTISLLFPTGQDLAASISRGKKKRTEQ